MISTILWSAAATLVFLLCVGAAFRESMETDEPEPGQCHDSDQAER